MAANNDLTKIKELIEIVNNKVGKLETHVSTHSATMHLIKDQQSVMNEKLDGLKKDVKEMSENVDAARGDIELLQCQTLPLSKIISSLQPRRLKAKPES